MSVEDSEKFVVEQIIDKRVDGETVYYFVKRKAALGDIYEWELENQLDCLDLIRKFEQEFEKKRKVRKMDRRNVEKEPGQKSKKRTRGKIFPCFSCATDSPFDRNRSLRGSVCDFS